MYYETYDIFYSTVPAFPLQVAYAVFRTTRMACDRHFPTHRPAGGWYDAADAEYLKSGDIPIAC